MAAGARRGSDARKDGERMTALHNVARSLVSMVRSSGIRKDYSIDDDHEIGRGRFGVVLKATRIADGEGVAIKKISKKGRNAKAIENVRTEIEVMRKVNHPNCIKLETVYESANHIYIVMELVRGGELLDRVINKEHYTELEAARCFTQIMSAIQYLHSKGIVHRDIKPENILYTETSKHSAVKLADYGLSRCFDADDLNMGRIRMMSRCGSPNFVAPEVLSGSGYGKSCDIWSAGIILYILLCGFLPFDQAEVVGQNKEKVTLPIIGVVDFPAPYWDPMSEESKKLVIEMLVIDPQARITSEGIMQHRWVEMCREGTLPTADMPQMQQRLKDNVVTRKLLGAVNSLSALRHMRRADVDWEAMHELMREMAVDCLSKIKLDPQREAELREGFDLLDRDNSGRISLINLEDSMKALGHLQDKEEVDFMMKRFDLYQTGDISFEEYCIMMSVPHDFLHSKWAPEPMHGNILLSSSVRRTGSSDSDASLNPSRRRLSGDAMGPESTNSGDGNESWRGSSTAGDARELRETFMALDVDSSGFVDPANIKELMSRFGIVVPEDEAKKMVEIADYKRNGVIDFDEFVELMSSESKVSRGSYEATSEGGGRASDGAAGSREASQKEVEVLMADSSWRNKPHDESSVEKSGTDETHRPAS